MIGPVEAILVIPGVAIPVLALISNYRLGAGLNILACAMTLTAALSLLFTEHRRSDLIIIDDFNIFLIVLTTFVGFTTSIFSATYLAHEIEIGRLTPAFLRFYHTMYQALMCAMNAAWPPFGGVSHGIAITADQKTLLVDSSRNSTLYACSLPDFAPSRNTAWLAP